MILIVAGKFSRKLLKTRALFKTPKTFVSRRKMILKEDYFDILICNNCTDL